jgi:Kef-type K+ transport system membrane component KefB
MDLRSLASSPFELAAFAALCLFAFFAKVFVGGAISRTLGWSGREALGAGFLVTSRGAVELAMATLLLDLGIFDRTLFTVVAGVGLVTTFLAPICARRFVGSDPGSAYQRAKARRGSGLPPPLGEKGRPTEP